MRFCGADERAHELAVDEGSDFVHVEAGGGEKVAGFLYFVDARWIYINVFKASPEKFVAIFEFFERARNTANPKLDALADIRGNFATDHDIGNGETTTWFEDAEGLEQGAIFVAGEVDNAVGDDYVHGIFREWNVFDGAPEK